MSLTLLYPTHALDVFLASKPVFIFLSLILIMALSSLYTLRYGSHLLFPIPIRYLTLPYPTPEGLDFNFKQ